jgi:hypothetical protein
MLSWHGKWLLLVFPATLKKWKAFLSGINIRVPGKGKLKAINAETAGWLGLRSVTTVLPNPSREDSASPDVKGADSDSSDPEDAGSVSPDPGGAGSISPDPKGTGIDLPDPKSMGVDSSNPRGEFCFARSQEYGSGLGLERRPPVGAHTVPNHNRRACGPRTTSLTPREIVATSRRDPRPLRTLFGSPFCQQCQAGVYYAA